MMWTLSNVLLLIYCSFSNFAAFTSDDILKNPVTRIEIQASGHINYSDKELAEFELKFNLSELNNVDQEYKDLMIKGIKQAYSLAPNLDSSFASFDKLTFLEPERPEGYFMKAALFSSVYRFHPTQANFDTLENYTNITIDLTERLLKVYPDDKFLHYYLGGVYGNIGLHYLAKKSYWKAYTNGRKGKNYLEKAIKLDPNFIDAYLGLGMFQYYADMLSNYLKPLLFIMRLNGDREKGLRNIKNAVINSSFSQIEAAYFLAKVYDRYEGKSSEAGTLYNKLLNIYPDNYYLKYSVARYYYQNGYFIESKKCFENLLLDIPKQYSVYPRSVHYYYGMTLYYIGEIEKSVYELNKSGLYGGFPKDMAVVRFYTIGLNYALLGQNKMALQYYKLANNVDSDLYKDSIKKCIEAGNSSIDNRILKIDNLLNKKLYKETEDAVNELYSQRQKNNSSSADANNSILLLQESEAVFNQDRPGEAEIIFDTIQPNGFSDFPEYLVRYYMLGAEINFSLDKFSESEDYIENTEDIDEDEIAVFYLRRVKNLQIKIFGKIKF